MIHALRSLMLRLHAGPGFISCRLCQEADDANTICYEEEWHTAEDLDRRIRSTHYTCLLAIMEAAAEPPVLRLNWVTEVKGREYLEAVRLCESKGRRTCFVAGLAVTNPPPSESADYTLISKKNMPGGFVTPTHRLASKGESYEIH
jgi:quinol monooxygenase YgiN